jgi:hypothetical protein
MNRHPAADITRRVYQAQVNQKQKPELVQHGREPNQHRHDQGKLDEGL